MRNKLIKVVRRRFGPVYGSKAARDARDELIDNMLDRFDEEVQNGATEQAAYRTALTLVGDLEELRTKCGVEKKRRIIIISTVTGIAVLLLAVAAALSFVLGTFLYFAGIAVGLFLAAYCVIRLLIGSRRKKLHIPGAAIGCLFAGSCFFYLLMFASLLLFMKGTDTITLPENEIAHVVRQNEPYFQSLDVGKDPCYIKRTADKTLIQNGEVVCLWLERTDGDMRSVSLSDPDQLIYAESIREEAEETLSSLQNCLQHGYFTEAQMNLADRQPHLMSLMPTEEGLALLNIPPSAKQVRILIDYREANETAPNAVFIQNRLFAPAGIELYVLHSDGAYCSYCYGTAYQYSISPDDQALSLNFDLNPN